jgi:hypothetical protein
MRIHLIFRHSKGYAMDMYVIELVIFERKLLPQAAGMSAKLISTSQNSVQIPVHPLDSRRD